jgi:pyruvate dehydrogenase E2 component (dihydrolipoamide acetyltransferase)
VVEEPSPDAGTAKGQVTTVELSRAQRTVARRVAEAKATIPDFTLTTEVDMAAALATRAGLDALVVKASALALRDHPRANAGYRDGGFELYSRVNVGVTVTTDEALLVPTIFDADTKPLDRIAEEARALAGKARDGTITSPELSGATFTVTDVGADGATSGTAIINGGQAGILAFGAVSDGRMTATLTCDHRILYGAHATRFLARIRALLENPAAL